MYLMIYADGTCTVLVDPQEAVDQLANIEGVRCYYFVGSQVELEDDPEVEA